MPAVSGGSTGAVPTGSPSSFPSGEPTDEVGRAAKPSSWRVAAARLVDSPCAQTRISRWSSPYDVRVVEGRIGVGIDSPLEHRPGDVHRAGDHPVARRSSFERVSTSSAPVAAPRGLSRGASRWSGFAPRRAGSSMRLSWCARHPPLVAAILARPAQDDVVRRDCVAASVGDALDRRSRARRPRTARPSRSRRTRGDGGGRRRRGRARSARRRRRGRRAGRARARRAPRAPGRRSRCRRVPPRARTRVVDLLGREAAVLPPEELDDQPARAPAAAARLAQARESGFGPGVIVDNDTCSQRRATVRADALARTPVRRHPVPRRLRRARAGGSRRATVVAAFYPLAWAAEQVAAADVHVVNLTPAGAEPHDLELTPRDVEAIQDADLVVYLGGGFQPAVEEAVAAREGAVARLLAATASIRMSGSTRSASRESLDGSAGARPHRLGRTRACG